MLFGKILSRKTTSTCLREIGSLFPETEAPDRTFGYHLPLGIKTVHPPVITLSGSKKVFEYEAGEIVRTSGYKRKRRDFVPYPHRIRSDNGRDPSWPSSEIRSLHNQARSRFPGKSGPGEGSGLLRVRSRSKRQRVFRSPAGNFRSRSVTHGFRGSKVGRRGIGGVSKTTSPARPQPGPSPLPLLKFLPKGRIPLKRLLHLPPFWLGKKPPYRRSPLHNTKISDLPFRGHLRASPPSLQEFYEASSWRERPGSLPYLPEYRGFEPPPRSAAHERTPDPEPLDG